MITDRRRKDIFRLNRARNAHGGSAVRLQGWAFRWWWAVADGLPLEAVENFEEELVISPEVFGRGFCFAVRVKGDTMIDVHIMDGDLVVIRSQLRVENGEIAAVMVEDRLPEATLKIFCRTQVALYLEPANPVYKTLVFKGPRRKRVSVPEKLVGVVRRG